MKMFAEKVRANEIVAFAMVYPNCEGGNGKARFMADMADAGVNTSRLVEGIHYCLNFAMTNALRSYTGELWIKAPVIDDLVVEMAQMLAERDSHPMFNEDHDLHIYNNPLFREAISLGVWGQERVHFGFKRVSHDVSVERITQIINVAKRENIQQRLIVSRAEMEKSKNLAAVLRKAKMRESAKDHASKASRLAVAIREMEFSLAEMVTIGKPAEAQQAAG